MSDPGHGKTAVVVPRVPGTKDAESIVKGSNKKDPLLRKRDNGLAEEVSETEIGRRGGDEKVCSVIVKGS